MTLRELRMWHWRELLNERRLQNKFEERARSANPGYYFNTNNGHAKRHKQQASLHLGAVQALNDVLTGTAEQDCMEETND